MELTNLKALAQDEKNAQIEEARLDGGLPVKARPTARRTSGTDRIPVKLPPSALKRKVIIACMLAVACLIGGCYGLFRAYIGNQVLQWERPVTKFVVVVNFTVFAFVCYVFYMFHRALTVGMIRKPFEYDFIDRMPHRLSRLFFHVFHSHGKYYLRRLYCVEILESMYQIYNFKLFACRMATGWLLLYCAVMASAHLFQLKQIYNIHKEIDNKGKNRENITDIFLELFCTIVPMCVIYYVHGIYFSENETIQIISVPLFAFIAKVLKVLSDEICVAIYDERLKQENAALPPSQQKKRRRSSMALKESALIKLQNEYVGLIWRKGILCFYTLFASFYVLLAGVQIYNLFIVEPDHFQYCKINVPSCSYWVIPKNNCLQIAHLTTTGKSSDEILRKFKGSDAAVEVKVSDVEDLTLVELFPLARRITVYKSNATDINIDWKKFKELIVVNLAEFPYATTAHSSLYENELHRLSLSDMPNLKLKAFKLRNAIQLELIRVGEDLPKITGKNIRVVALVGYGLRELPKEFEDLKKFTTLKVSDNNLTRIEQPITFLVDARDNQLSKEGFPKTLAEYNYGFGNLAPCPDGWKCEKDTFCHPDCTNAYHLKKTYPSCTLDCVTRCGIGMCADFIE